MSKWWIILIKRINCGRNYPKVEKLLCHTSAKSTPLFAGSALKEMAVIVSDTDPQKTPFLLHCFGAVIYHFSSFLPRRNKATLITHPDQPHPGQPAWWPALAFSAHSAVGPASQLHGGWAEAPFPCSGRLQLPGSGAWGVLVLFQLRQVWSRKVA